MAIEQLGESLLSQARDRKKKEKKKAKLFTGLMLGVQVGNMALRKRAEKRANQFWNSNQGLINQRANQFDTGVNFYKDHNAMIKTYGESLDKETGENWVSAFNSSKLKQYQTSPEYSDLYRNKPQEFNKIVKPLLENDRLAYREKVSGYSDFKNITSSDKETKTAYIKPLKDKLQKGIDVINKQDNIAGWAFSKLGFTPSTKLVPLENKDGKVMKDNKGNVTMVPAGLGDETKTSLIASITQTVGNWNKIQSAVGVKEKFTTLQLQSLVPKPKVIELSIEPDKEFKDIFLTALSGESDTENLKQKDFTIAFGSGRIAVSEFLNQFEITQGDKTETNIYLTDTQKENVYQDALKLANYRYTLQVAQGKKTGLGSLQLPDGGKKKYFDDALQEIVAGDFEFKMGRDGVLGFGSDEARGVYNRKTVSNFIGSIVNKDVITIPDKNNKPLEVPEEVITEVFTDEVLTTETNEINKLTTPDEVMNEFRTAYLNDPNFNNASGEIKAGVIKGILLQYPEMSGPLSGMFVDMLQRGQVDDTAFTDMKQRGEVDSSNIITMDNLKSVNIVVGKAADGSDINWSDRPIINKIIEVESSGKINAMSDHGAKGLMQIKDATADKPGMGVSPAVRDKAGNISAEENVIFGTNYFDALTERYNGDLVTATMAYNAGMGTIDKWIKEGRNYNDLRTETQNYVGKIFGKDIQELVKAGTYGQDIIQTSIETPTVSSPSLLSPNNTLSSEEMNKRMDEGISKMGEDSVSLAQILRMDKESTRKRVIKKAEKYLENPKSFFSSSIFSKWVKETKGIEAYKIKKEDKPKAVEEFLEFLNQ